MLHTTTYHFIFMKQAVNIQIYVQLISPMYASNFVAYYHIIHTQT